MLAGFMFSRTQPVHIADQETIGLISIQMNSMEYDSECMCHAAVLIPWLQSIFDGFTEDYGQC